MTRAAHDPIVVGADGSDDSLRAVAWAAREAALRNLPLRVVHVFVWPLMGVPLGPSDYGPTKGGFTNQAHGFVGDAIAHAKAAAPDITASGEMITGTAIPTLVRESRHASMIVVGHRGLGGFTGLLIGSVGVGLAAHAGCPVTIVRPATGERGPSTGRVVVGVDGSPHSELALGFAFEEASLRGVGLTVLHAWAAPTSVAPGDMIPLVYDIDAVHQEESRLLAELLAGWCEKYPDVEVRRRVVHARAARTLVDESPGAELLVVGSRGRGGFSGMLLGSVSQAMIHHAGCPVAVIRDRH